MPLLYALAVYAVSESEIEQIDLPESDKAIIKKVSLHTVQLPSLSTCPVSGPGAYWNYLPQVLEAAAWMEGSHGICFEPHLLPFPAEG